jgi:hypothetical protein
MKNQVIIFALPATLPVGLAMMRLQIIVLAVVM